MAEEQPTIDTEQPPVESAKEEEVGPDELTALRQELEQTKAKEAEYLDGWQRARAELANARKRFQRDQEQAYANAAGQVLSRLLPIVDDLERAFNTLPHNLSGLTWIGGSSSASWACCWNRKVLSRSRRLARHSTRSPTRRSLTSPPTQSQRDTSSARCKKATRWATACCDQPWSVCRVGRFCKPRQLPRLSVTASPVAPAK
jgi:hypothetical protein